MDRVSRAFAAFVCGASLATAQLPSQDWIVASYGFSNPGLHVVSPATGAVLSVVPGGYFPVGVVMAPNNVDLLVAGSTSLDLVTLGGLVVPTSPISNGYGGQLAPDQDGTYLCAEDWGLYRLDPTTGSEDWTWSGVYAFLNGVCVDGDTGDYVVGEHGYFYDGRVTRIHRTTGVATTIAAGLGPVQSVDFDPLTGEFLVANGDAFAPVLRVARNGAVTALGTSVVPTGATAVRVDPTTGNLLVVGPNAARMVTPLGATVANVAFSTPMDYPGGVELSGSRKVSGFGAATAGSDYFVRLAFPGGAGRAYTAALSTAMRPGIPLNDGTGRVVSLAADWLFNATIGGIPGLLDGFSGVLDANGSAIATVHVPAGFPAGVRFFVSAVVANPAAPSGLETANTWGFTTN
jgi:hypothetical protein